MISDAGPSGRLDPAPGYGPPRTEVAGWQRPFRLIGAILAKVFVEPIARGRFRIVNWPRGLPLLAILVTACYVVAMTIAVAAPWLRAHLRLELVDGPSGLASPASLTWVIFALLFVAAVVFQTGALHTVWWFRLIALVISFTLLTTAGGSLSSVRQLALLIGAGLALIIFQIIRWRRDFRWWEYVVVACCYVAPLIGAAPTMAQGRAFGYTGATSWLALTMPQVEFLAAPIAILAGYAIAQWAFATVIWTVDLGRRQLPSWVLMVVLVGLLLWRFGAEWWSLANSSAPDLSQVLWPGGLVVGSVLLWVIMDKVADRRAPGTTRIADLNEDLRSVALPLALIMALSGALEAVLSPLKIIADLVPAAGVFTVLDPVINLATGTLGAVVTAVIMMAWAIRRAIRADRGRAELLAVMALLFLATKLTSATGATDLLGLWVITPVAALFVVLLVRRRLGRRRLEGLLVVVGLTAVLSTRQFFADPATAILGGSAALIISLIWTFLTTGEDANEESARFPLPARVCLLLANSLIGMVALAYHQLSLGPFGVLDLQQRIGDRVLGGALILGGLVATMSAVVRREELSGSEPERPAN